MNIILMLLALSAPTVEAQKIQGLRTFQNPDEVSEDLYLSNPYAMEFAKDGRLFIADRFTSRIHSWNADGSYLRTFGAQGEGPGEIFFPYQLEAKDGRLYVWSSNAQMSVFDLDGTYQTSFKYAGAQVRNFAVLNPKLFLFFTQKINSPTDLRMVAILVNDEGEIVDTVKEWKDGLVLAPVEGNNNTTIKAFGPELDIQEAGDGTWYFGYSTERILYQINDQGKIIGQKRFDLPTSRPTEDDIALYNSMSFPSPDGGRLALKDLPNLKVDYSHDKAYYTQFTIMGDKVLFVLHPLGGTNGVGYGFYQGTYVIADLKTGKPEARGTYKYGEDSQLLLRNGHVLGLIINDEDSYDIVDMKLSNLRTAAK